MPTRNPIGSKRLAQAALIAGLAIGTTTAIVYAAPSVDPAPPPNAGAPTESMHSSQSDSTSLGTEISDTSITTKVKYNLMNDDRLKGSSIKVTTDRGVVELKGQVQSEQQKDAAEQVVQQTKGVKGVDSSQIIVATSQ